LSSSLKDLVAAQQCVKLVNRLQEVIEKLFAAILEACRQIHHQAADTEV